MAKVEMSLSEYDAMKSALDFYKNIVTNLFSLKNVTVDQWDKKYYDENDRSFITLRPNTSTLDAEEVEFLNNLAHDSLEEFLKKNELEGVLEESIYISLGELRHLPPKETEEE